MSLESRKNTTLDDPGAELLDQAQGLWDRYGRIVLGVIAGLALVALAAYYVASRDSAVSPTWISTSAFTPGS